METFASRAYRGHNFLMLKSSDKKSLSPASVKGGPWLSAAKDVSNATFARMCRCILAHALIGEYYRHFNIPDLEGARCTCGFRVQT